MDIDAWLRGIGLAQYAEQFRSHDIDADLLRRLSDTDLKEIGVASLGHRKKLLEAITAIGPEPAAGTASPAAAATASITSAVERRHLTVMFVDLVGSTALSAELDPEDLSQLIRAYQSTVADEIARFEGHIAQFLGDGVLAYFGWPRAHEDEAERAVRAALSVTAAVARVQTPAAMSLQTRIGIATGMVVVGDRIAEGSGQRYAVVGETPNFAARLQAIAEPGTVVIAEATRHLLGDQFALRAVGAQTFKGIADPARAFVVLGERVLESRFAARQSGGPAPVVGRDQELALLVERWHQASAGEGQVVLLSGEAGIGKSRITEAVIGAARAEPHFLLRYQCSPYHADSALYPVIQQLTHAAGFVEADSTESRLDRLEALLAVATDHAVADAPLIATLLGIDGALRYGASTLTPAQRRNRTLRALIDQLTGLAGRKPVLWVVEDAHWIDPTTLELIELAVGHVQGARVLALITARPTFVATFGSHPLVTRLALNRLGRAATQAIVTHITRGKRLPTDLFDEIAAKTDGVPLFVEEVTKAVLEAGVLREAEDAYHLDGPLSALAIPTSLHDSLMARLDRLEPVKEVAQTAAVIGRSFDHRTVAALSSLPEAELAAALRQLVEAELIFRRGSPPEATYLFKHALVRDAAYGSLLKSSRITLHARLVDVLEAHGAAAPEVKAQHAEAAGLTERALGYWEQAGTQALTRPAYQEAISHLESAIRLCRAMGDDLQWKRREQGLHLQRGQALIANQGFAAPATLAAFERARAIAAEIGDVALELPAAYGHLAYSYVSGRSTVDAAERFVALASRQPDRGPRLVADRHLGMARFHAGRFHDALVLYRRSIAGYDPAAHRELMHRYGQDNQVAANSYLGIVLWVLGFPDQAAAAADEALERSRELAHPPSMAYALGMGVSWTNICLRRPDRVAHAARESLRLSEQLSLANYRGFALVHLGWAQSQLNTATGLAEIEAGLREKLQIGTGRWTPLDQSLAADAYSRAGRHEDASASIARAFESVAFGNDVAFVAELHRKRAALLLEALEGGRNAAESELRSALKIAHRQGALSLELRAARDLARLIAERGERQQAADLLAPVYGAFTEGFDTADLIEARSLLDSLPAPCAGPGFLP